MFRKSIILKRSIPKVYSESGLFQNVLKGYYSEKIWGSMMKYVIGDSECHGGGVSGEFQYAEI